MEHVKKKVLLVEDDSRLANLVKAYLEQQEFEIEVDYSGDATIAHIDELAPDLIILDLMLPKMDGIDLCRLLRQRYHGPIIILTAKESDIDQVVGLETGADDYIIKPIEPVVLLARIRSLLRRFDRKPEDSAVETALSYGELSINKETQTVVLQNEKVQLTSQEFDLLFLLAKNPGVILSRDEIFRQLRGFDYDGLDRTVDVRISRLRKKLKDNTIDPEKIKTIWGKGYLFVKGAW